MNRHELELVKVLADSMEKVARAVAEGMGEGISKAMGYGLVVPQPQPEPEPEDEYLADILLPDVELDDNWIRGDSDAGI